jgi:hypothetical protein
MTILPTPADYTDKDFESLNRRLELLLQAVFPAWTDFNRAAYGNILKECFAFSMDVVAFYQDQQAAETRWGTASLRESIIELARLIGYTLSGASAATVDVVFTMNRVLPGDVTIPAGTVIKTTGRNPERFQTLAAVTIASGATVSAAVSAEHSEQQDATFTATGEADEEYILTKTPYLDGSLVLEIAGAPWTQVDNFLESTAVDTHYVLFVDEDDRATVRVGDGTNGAVPVLGSAVTAEYKTGGGSAGNVEANSILRVEGSFSDTFGNPATMTCDNALAAEGGMPRETVEEAKVKAPASLRVLNRTIARTDWEDLAIQVDGIGRALMVTKDEVAAIPEEGRGYLYLVPETGGVPSAAKKAEVEDYINDNFPIPLNFSWEAADPIYNTIDIVAYVYLEANATVANVNTAVTTALQEYFAPVNADGTPNEEVDFGYNYKDSAGDPEPLVALSVIQNIINDVVGIRRLGSPFAGEGITLNGVEGNVTLALREFPEGGTLTLFNGDTGAIFPGHPVVL